MLHFWADLSADLSWTANSGHQEGEAMTTLPKTSQEKNNMGEKLLVNFYWSSFESVLTYCISVLVTQRQIRGGFREPLTPHKDKRIQGQFLPIICTDPSLLHTYIYSRRVLFFYFSFCNSQFKCNTFPISAIFKMDYKLIIFVGLLYVYYLCYL